jgi:pimeloyl-ACP methyl ester carboxylesterase
MSERALLFGENKSLVGVITDPEPFDPSRRPLGVIILNAGLIHRVGPNRLHVQIARRLAANGCVVLRFDYSGIGDSEARRDNTPFAKLAIAETQQAMDLLAASRGVERFVLMGICSGADNALRTASIDQRVAGLVLIEGYSVPTRGYLVHSYKKKLLNPRSWLRLLVGKSELWSLFREVSSRPDESESEGEVADSVLPSRTEVVAQLDVVLKRGVEICFIFSATSSAYYQYCKLLRPRVRLLAPGQKSRIEIFPASDHVFTLLSNQARLIGIVQTWIGGLERGEGAEHYPQKAAGAREAATLPR